MAEPVTIHGPPIPASGGRRVPDVVWPRPKRSVDVVLLGGAVEAYYTHPILEGPGGKFVRSELCTGGSCVYAHDFTPSRWCGFACAWDRAKRSPVVVMLTPEAARGLRRCLGPQGRMRGLHVLLTRASSHEASVVQVRVVAAESDAGLPAPFSSDESLRRLWRLPLAPSQMCDYGAAKGGGE